MSNCFLCGKKIGFFDPDFFVDKQPLCSECNKVIRTNIDDVIEECKSKEEIESKRIQIIKDFERKYSNDKLTLIINHINNICNLYYKDKPNENANLKCPNNVSVFQKEVDSHMLTTGYDFHGYEIEEYKGLVSGECVIGTGIMADLFSDFSDLTGSKSKTFSDKMKEIKHDAMNEMIKDSVKIGGNAIIGISYDHITFSGKNMIGISVNGTSVKIKKIEEE